MIRINKEHRTLALKDFQDQDIEAVLKRPAFCQKKRHEKEELKFFCKDCKVAICSTCAVTLHESHGKMLLEEATDACKTQINSMTQSLIEKEQEKRKELEEFNQKCSTDIKLQVADFPQFSFTKSAKRINVLNSEGIGNVTIALSEIKAQQSGAKGKESSKVIAGNKGANVRDSPFETQEQTRCFRSLLSFGRQGKSVGMLNAPWGVAVNDQDEIAVTEFLNHRVSVFSSEGSHLRSFGRVGENDGKFQFPKGIAFDSLGNIVVADNNNHRVQVFDRNGNFLGKFGEQGSLDHQLSNPVGLSINGNGDINVADKDNKLIKIFSSSGEYLRKFGTSSLVLPYHCIQHGQYFIVSDYGDNSIKMFNLEGEFISKFGKQGNKDGEFRGPCYLSVNKEGLLMVCDERNHRVQVFELSGKFVTKFGSEGSEREEFKNPLSAANLSDGRIVVCEFDNNRIQVFEHK